MAASVRDKPVEEMTAFEAVFLTFDYWQRITAEDHARTREALERVVESEPESADAWASLAMMYCEEHKHGYNVRPDPLGRTIQAARRAVDIDPTSQHAYYALAEANFFRRDFGALRAAAERAIALNPRDGNTVAFMGILYCYASEWEEGLALVRRALELNPHHPGWYRFAIINDHYRKGEYEDALAEAQAVNLPGYWPTHAIIAAAAGRLDRLDVARRAIEELVALFPDFAARGRAELGKWFADEKLLDAYMEGMAMAGLEAPAPPL
jgi:tetratricopeptide (TPR) repeat protein